jgi:hypothetical protein
MSDDSDSPDGSHSPSNLLDEFLAQGEIIEDALTAAIAAVQSMGICREPVYVHLSYFWFQ